MIKTNLATILGDRAVSVCFAQSEAAHIANLLMEEARRMAGFTLTNPMAASSYKLAAVFWTAAAAPDLAERCLAEAAEVEKEAA